MTCCTGVELYTLEGWGLYINSTGDISGKGGGAIYDTGGGAIYSTGDWAIYSTRGGTIYSTGGGASYLKLSQGGSTVQTLL